MKKKSSKEQVVEFLDKRPFLNSRVAFRAFKAQNVDSKISQIYFYTLFAKFGQREKKKDDVIKVIQNGPHKNCMGAYRKYKNQVDEPVSFAYFLNVWKKEFNLGDGPIRQKTKTAEEVLTKAKKITKKDTTSVLKGTPAVEVVS